MGNQEVYVDIQEDRTSWSLGPSLNPACSPFHSLTAFLLAFLSGRRLVHPLSDEGILGYLRAIGGT